METMHRSPQHRPVYYHRMLTERLPLQAGLKPRSTLRCFPTTMSCHSHRSCKPQAEHPYPNASQRQSAHCLPLSHCCACDALPASLSYSVYPSGSCIRAGLPRSPSGVPGQVRRSAPAEAARQLPQAGKLRPRGHPSQRSGRGDWGRPLRRRHWRQRWRRRQRQR
jgi:hypothetical protein